MHWMPEDLRHDPKVYKQVEVVKGTTKITTWAELEYAVEGKQIRLQRNGVWEEGWTVDTVYDMERTGEQLRIQRNTRKGYEDRKGPTKRKHYKRSDWTTPEGWS